MSFSVARVRAGWPSLPRRQMSTIAHRPSRRGTRELDVPRRTALPKTAKEWRPYRPAALSALQRYPKRAEARAALKALRAEGYVPGVLSSAGAGARDVAVAIKGKALAKQIEGGAFFNRTYDVAVADDEAGSEAATYRCIVTDLKVDPVSNAPVGVTLFAYDPEEPRLFYVPVKALNGANSPAVRRGGQVRVVHANLPLLVRCDDVPRELPIDIAHLEHGETAKVGEIEVPSWAVNMVGARPNEALFKMIDRWR